MINTSALLLLALQAPTEPIALEEVLEPIRAERDLAALSAAIVGPEGLIAIGAVGHRARGKEALVLRSDRWHIGSCTKSMTATLIARLAEAEVLSLDSTLDVLFPEYAEEMAEDWRHVKLTHLLQHRAGIEPNPMQMWAELAEHPDGVAGARAMLVRETLLAPPDLPPGEFVYSNWGYAIAGAAAERATGSSWEDLIREHVFAPLGMKSAGFGPPGTEEELDEPRGHAMGKLPVYGDNPAWMGPAGTVHASLADWGRYIAFHLAGARGEDTELLSKESFARMHTAPEGSPYAFGWLREERDWAKGDVLWHNGSNTMWYTLVFIAPERNIALLAACNQADPAAMTGVDEAITASFELWDARQ